MVSPRKMPSLSLAVPGGEAEDSGHWPGRRLALQPRHRARPQDQHAEPGLAAQDLLPRVAGRIEPGPVHRIGEDGGRGVAEREPRAIGGDPLRIGHPHARSGAVPDENRVAVGIDLREVGQAAVRRIDRACVQGAQLAGAVVRPKRTEIVPAQKVRPARAEQRPHGHLDGAGVGARNDSDPPLVRQPEKRARSLQQLLDARPAARAPDGTCRAALPRGRRPTIRAAWGTARRRIGGCRDGRRASCAVRPVQASRAQTVIVPSRY